MEESWLLHPILGVFTSFLPVENYWCNGEDWTRLGFSLFLVFSPPLTSPSTLGKFNFVVSQFLLSVLTKEGGHIGEVRSCNPLWGSGWMGSIGVWRVLVNSGSAACQRIMPHPFYKMWYYHFPWKRPHFSQGPCLIQKHALVSSTWDWQFSVCSLVWWCPSFLVPGLGRWNMEPGRASRGPSFVGSAVDAVPAVGSWWSLFLRSRAELVLMLIISHLLSVLLNPSS